MYFGLQRELGSGLAYICAFAISPLIGREPTFKRKGLGWGFLFWVALRYRYKRDLRKEPRYIPLHTLGVIHNVTHTYT